MNSRFVWAAVFLTAASLLSADPRSAVGRASGPVVVVVTGEKGTVRLLHEGTLVREVETPDDYQAAVILAGPLDTVEWDGKPATLLAAGADPMDTARRALDGDDHQFIINADGAVEVKKGPKDDDDDEEEGEYDGETAATEE